MAISLVSGGMLVACGGSDSSVSAVNDSKLLADGEPCNAAWSSGTVYFGGNQVSYSGRNYSAAYYTQGDNPGTKSGAAGSGQPWIAGFLCGNTVTTTTNGGSTSTIDSTTSTTGASSCAAYVAGGAYSVGQTVTNKGGNYTCKVAGWCSSGASAYEPGGGWAYDSAWSVASADACTATTTSSSSTTSTSNSSSSTATTSSTTATTSVSSCPAYVAGTSYAVGQTVTNKGGYYACAVAGWCSSGASAYEPGAGWASSSAWTTSSASACDAGTTTTIGNGTTTTLSGTRYCARDFDTKKIYSKGAIVAYKGAAYEALVDTYAIPPDSTVYTGQWKVVGVPDPSLCPVSIPNTIDYGVAQPVGGNATAGTVRASGAISSARIANTASTITPRSGVYATDMGGDHPGFDSDTGARVAKLAPGSLPLQHNIYTQPAAGQEIVSYLGDWAIYGRRWDFSKTPVKNLNRLVYGFAGICFPAAKNVQDPGFPTSAPAAVNRTCAQSKLPDGAMAIADFEAAFVRTLPGGQTSKVTGIESMYDLSPTEVGGVFGVLYNLRKANPHLKLDLSVGGWTLSEGFGWMAKDPVRRKVFVDSTVRFLQQFDFDGIDIDWEYPGADGAVPDADSPEDAANYLQLMKDLRAGMDWLTVKTGKHYRLSSAIAATKGKLDIINWTEAGKYLDRLYVMTYDLTGAWERNISQHTPLYNNPNANGSSTGSSASVIIEYLNTKYGVPMNKLMIGAANYGRSKRIVPGDIKEYTNGLKGDTTYKSDVAGGTTNFILTIAGIGTWEAGVMENYDMYTSILDKDMKPRNGYHIYTDKSSNADYLAHPNGSFITIETPRTVALKTQYAKDKKLGGVFFWMIEQDNGYNLNAVNHVLGNPLVSSSSDGKPGDQIATCGENVTAAECQALNSSIK